MISKRCAAFLFQFVAVMDLTCEFMCHPKTGDRYTRNANAAFLNRPRRDAFMGRSNTDPCQAFEVGNKEKQEFYSPGYPENYPNNTECFRVLEAPPGHIVRLDFRDRFVLEGDCKNDYLEVRDGAHGFNTQIEEHFCGTKFPPMITSSDRHLWLHFRSDDNIEHSGFKAVYEFVPRPPDLKTPERIPCTIHVTGDEGTPRKGDINNKTIEFNMENGLPTDCLWIITVKDGWKIQLSFLKFSLERPNDCDSNFVDVFSTNTDIPSRNKIFCGSIADTVTSKSNVMYIRYFAEPKASKSTFEALFTAFRESDKSSNECLPDEFNCEDAKCISATLRCNGQVNCHFKWDEDDCDNNMNKPLSENHIIIIMVIFSLILSGMCFTFIFNCVKKLIRDHRTIREYIRQSREQQLNELGKQDQFEKKIPKLTRSRSNSTQSSSSQRFDAANAMTNTPCYVPGGELLPIIIRNEHSLSGNTNGDTYNQTVRAYDDDGSPQPEMCDSACQTRESLFTTLAYSSEHSTPNHSITSTHSKPSPPAPFSTFGYKKENKYRAEAKIEMEKIEPPKMKYEEKRRPYSVQTTKSAPDVIVTH